MKREFFILSKNIIYFFQQMNLFGHPGAGGQYGYGDTQCKLGVAYTTNFLDLTFDNFEEYLDERFNTLLKSTYDCIRPLEGTQRRVFSSYGQFVRIKESETGSKSQEN